MAMTQGCVMMQRNITIEGYCYVLHQTRGIEKDQRKPRLHIRVSTH